MRSAVHGDRSDQLKGDSIVNGQHEGMDHPECAALEFEPDRMRRIAVIGTSCSGKTTLARRLAAQLVCPHLELDAFHWGPNWTENPREQVRAAIDEQTRQPTWVSCGNYSFLRDIVWQRADAVVWINYPFSLVAGRALRRTFGRSLRRKELWNGNRESLRKALLSRDSILWWVVKTWGANRRAIPQTLALPEFAHLQLIELTRPDEALQLVDKLTERAATPPQ
jgi:adenylate kinase family enzyme